MWTQEGRFATDHGHPAATAVALPQNSSPSAIRQHYHCAGNDSTVVRQPVHVDTTVGLGYDRYSLRTSDCATLSMLRGQTYKRVNGIDLLDCL